MKNFGKVAILSTGILLGTSTTHLPFAELGVEAYASTTSQYQTTTNLNMRSGAGANYKVLMTIPKGKTVTSSSKSGNWHKVSYTYSVRGKSVTKTGWVSRSFLKKNNAPAAAAPAVTTIFPKTIFHTTAGLNLRAGAGTNHKTVLTIPKGKTVSATERSGSWYKVSYSYLSGGKTLTKTGWVSGSFLKEYYQYINTAGTYYFTNKAANLHPTPDTKQNATLTLQAGNGLYSTQKVVNSLGETWYRVSFNGKSLYVRSTEVQQQSVAAFSEATYLAVKNTFVYQSYGHQYSQLSSIPMGTVVSSKERVGDWYKVSFSGKTGYVYIGDFTLYKAPSESVLSPSKNFEAISSLSLKTLAHENSQEVASIPTGTMLTPTHQTSNGWYKVLYEGKNGYVPVSALKEVQVKSPEPILITEEVIASKTYLVTANLNLRQAADEIATILGSIPKNTIVIPTHRTSNGWYKVAYGGKTAYVSGTFLQEVKTGDPLVTRDSYQFIDLRTQSTVTGTQIDNYIANFVKLTGKKSVLTSKGQVFIDAGKKYGVNALYLAAHAIHESAYGTSELAHGKYNLFGFGAYDLTPYVGAYSFSSVEENIDYIAREMKATYLNPSSWKYNGAYLGFVTKSLSNVRIDSNSEGMNFYYATDENWGKLIAKHMQNMLPYSKEYYDQVTVNLTVPTKPAVPAGRDIFPAGIVAVAKANLVMNSKLGVNDAIKTIPAGTKFEILEKTNTYWVRVKVDGVEYWTNSIRFDLYTSYITVLNLGRVASDTLNIRPEPSTAKPAIGTFTLNTYVQLVLNADGTVKTDTTKTWYQVYLPTGGTAWVSALYINRELR